MHTLPDDAQSLEPLDRATPQERWLGIVPARIGSPFVYVPIPLVTHDGEPAAEVGPLTTTVFPRSANKVTSDGIHTTVRSEPPAVYGTPFPEVAAFWSLTDGHHSPLSIDTGVCGHWVPTVRPDLPGTRDHVITLMGTWSHWEHGRGAVAQVLGSVAGFQAHPLAPHVHLARSTVHVVNKLMTIVDRRILPVRPVLTRNDPVMTAAGAEGDLGEDLPLRGPHRPFDPAYACGAVGGQLFFHADGKVSVRRDQAWTLAEREDPLASGRAARTGWRQSRRYGEDRDGATIAGLSH